MQIHKRTIPSTPGGLLNKAFIYVPSASTDISVTFAKARAAQVQPAIFPDTVSMDRAFSRVSLRKLPGGARA